MRGIFDSHAHYDDSSFQGDRSEVFRLIQENGVQAVLNVGCDLDSSRSSLKFAETYPFFYAAVGIHPEFALQPEGWLEELEALCEQKTVVAIGEIGLDYHYDDAPPREVQRETLALQLELAQRRELPVIIHSRDATADTLQLLRQYRPKGVLHCYSGSWETAREVLELGMYLGFTGVVTFPNAKKAKEVAKMMPLERLLLETDCPYMAPVPYRGKRTTSDMIAYTAAAIGELRGMSAQEVVDAARENTCRLFNIKRL